MITIMDEKPKGGRRTRDPPLDPLLTEHRGRGLRGEVSKVCCLVATEIPRETPRTPKCAMWSDIAPSRPVCLSTLRARKPCRPRGCATHNATQPWFWPSVAWRAMRDSPCAPPTLRRGRITRIPVGAEGFELRANTSSPAAELTIRWGNGNSTARIVDPGRNPNQSP